MSAHLLECIDCGHHHLPAEVEYVCPACSAAQKPMQPLNGLLRCVYEYDTAARSFERDALRANNEQGLARWLPILPISSAKSLPPLIESATPLRPAERLRLELGLSSLWLKDDTVQPTASFKDRASAMVVAVARERGHDIVATASTGNAATALAGQAAAVGISSVIFAPSTAPAAKLAQIALFGGRLFMIKGTYDEAFELSVEACSHFGWYNRNTAYNPYTVEGKKTAALEIWEQLDYQAPDWVIVPTGDGVIAAGIEQGFRELAAMKLIERRPRLALVQADGCMPIVRAYDAPGGVPPGINCILPLDGGGSPPAVHDTNCSAGGRRGRSLSPSPRPLPSRERGAEIIIVPEKHPHTIADSICVGVPRAGRWAMRALAATKGVAVAVRDEEILSAIGLLGATAGVFAEPAAAASIAGLKRLVAMGTIKSDERIVALITGSGLKDVPAAMRAVNLPAAIKPSLNAVSRVMRG